MKKILLIADSNMSLSGVPVVFMSIVKKLHQKYTFDIIVLKDNDMYFEKEFLSYGGKIFKFNCPKPDNFIKKFFWLTTVYYKKVKSFLEEKVKLDEYIAIHSFHEGFSYPFLKEAKKAGIQKRILHICSAKSAYPQKKTFSQIMFDWYQKKAMKNCSNIVFPSQQSLKMKDYKNKGSVLYSEIEEAKIIECSHNNLVLSQIGTFSLRKNQLFSLEVIKKIKNEFPEVILNVVGSEIEKGYFQQMKDYIDANNLQKNIKFLGSKVDRIKLDEETSYVLYPSTMESFGLVLVESQACGIHCFANSGIPHDADMGNTDFIDLNIDLWADKIINYFKENGNSRRKPINMDRFSSEQFEATLNLLYKC